MSTNDDANEPKRKPGRPKGLPKTGGRVKGKLPAVTAEVKQNIAEFFTNLTRGNLRWRQRAARCLEGGDGLTPQEFRAWTRLALDYSVGTPSKHVAEKPQREPLLFIQHRMNDPMKEKTDRMIASKDQEDRLLALEEGRQDPEAILAAARASADLKKVDAPEDGEALERVVPPPEEFVFQPPVRERDRLPGHERDRRS